MLLLTSSDAVIILVDDGYLNSAYINQFELPAIAVRNISRLRVGDSELPGTPVAAVLSQALVNGARTDSLKVSDSFHRCLFQKRGKFEEVIGLTLFMPSN